MISLDNINLDNLKLDVESKELIKKLILEKKDTNFKIAVLGEFSVGKSAIINNLINKDLLPTHSIETTAIPTNIKYSNVEKMIINKFNGDIVEADVSQLQSLKANDDNVYEIENIDVFLNSPEWLEDLEIIDTPGRNTKFEQHKIASQKAFIESDIGIYIMNWKGLSRDDLLYIQEILEYQKNLLFVVNKVDLINESEDTSREEIIENIKDNLQQSLGLEFPVIATSIKEENTINQLKNDYILNSKKNMEVLKNERYEYVLQQLLNNHIQKLNLELEKLNLLTTTDNKKLEYEKNRINNLIEDEKIEIQRFITDISKKINYKKNELIIQYDKEFEKEISTFKREIQDLTTINISDLQDELTNKMLKIQEKLKSLSENQLNNILDDTIKYQPKPINNDEFNKMEIQEFDFTYLQDKYIKQKENTLKKYNDINERLNNKNKNFSSNENDIKLLQDELRNIEEEIEEKYVPQYIQQTHNNVNKNEKLMNVIGIIGDIGVSVALGALTGGASVAGQLSAEAAKQGTKAAGKEAAKTTIKVTAKETGKRISKDTLKNTSKKIIQKVALSEKGKKIAAGAVKGASENFKDKVKKENELRNDKMSSQIENNGESNKFVDVLDFVTSPIQSISRNIGKNMDAQALNNLSKKEDMDYKREFFENRRYKLEKFNKMERELKELKSEQSNNERLKQKIESKLIENEKNLKLEQQRIEEEYEKELKEKQQQYLYNNLFEQLDIVSEQVKGNMIQWLNIEISELLNIVKQTVPSIQLNKLEELQSTLNNVNIDNQNNFEENQNKIQEINRAIEECKLIIGENNE
ncbi:dynamin family protein [Staphylococcus hominis]|uniref:dynamin family protein n=1 Tax=Staphylococcus hominis TaxID=1290 RepID=UPI001886CAE0|nr:dynamin family protein [Staphylococcus hominis]MBF2307025.1 dynamin family protein [Staphylococcus hominis]MBF2315660.1 dynamin family protein [Staphylococcus hominis]MBF2320263.1 dynamin family protein [Staphylococcus hominis]